MEKTKYVDFGEKLAKVLAYIFSFLFVLGGAVVSKGTFMFMVAQLNSKEIGYCNKDIGK